ncbi:MAG: hypothetical protein F4090_06140 [Nitrospira sp. SB0672_bin_25]|nr:hypothetical protein [Nitrospira sp. SB0666_bin_27]MYJ54465.1 hypothetical protein [Nitrospira sp. SB0672_bin_25]
MKYRMYWGLSALVLIIIGVTVFSVLKDRAEIRRLKNELAIALHGHNHADGDPAHSDGTEDNPPNDVRPVKPIKQVDIPKMKPDQSPKAEAPKPKPKKPLYKGPLTFHEELLKTNPVKALRLQQEERGHWSAEWIPPFPTNDTEAQEFARAEYLWRYYIQNYGYEKLDTPEYEEETKEYIKARSINSRMWDTIMSYPYGARKSDLMKLSWPGQETPISVWSDGTVDPYPSEYFGNAELREREKQLGIWDY